VWLSWAICAVSFPVILPVFLLLSFIVVAFEESGRYVEAAGVTVVVVLALVYVNVLPGLGEIRLAERWAAATRLIGQGLWAPPTSTPGGRLSKT
jgi:adenylate cyclase